MGNLITCAKHRRMYLPELGCAVCNEKRDELARLDDIQSNYMHWLLSEQQDEAFAWLIKTIRKYIDGSN